MGISINNSNGKTKVTVDGKTIVINSSNVNVINGQIFADGKLYVDKETFKEDTVIQNVTIEGNVGTIECQGSVIVDGNVENRISCGGSLQVKGAVNGNINCGGSATIFGGQQGNINTGGSVRTYK